MFYITISFSSTKKAQFGITKENPSSKTIHNENEQRKASETITNLTEQDAIEIAQIIQTAGEDPQTIQLIAKLKDENSESLSELKQLPPEQILNNLKVTLDELKMLEYLFKDVDRALVEMEKEGLIPEEHLKKYRKDPSLLEKDTRSAVYFRFISLAVVGGYL